MAGDNREPFYYGRLFPIILFIAVLVNTVFNDPIPTAWRPLAVPILFGGLWLWIEIRKRRDPNFAREQKVARENYQNTPFERWRRSGQNFLLSAIGIFIVFALIVGQLHLDRETDAAVGLWSLTVFFLALPAYILWTGIRALWR
jgi:hypothetical protein